MGVTKIKKSLIKGKPEIRFLQELSTGALVFEIITSKYETAGHILCYGTDIKIIVSQFYILSHEDELSLREKVKTFCEIIDSF